MNRFWLWYALGVAFSASLAGAAITVSGDIDPANPATWTSATYGSIGKTTPGALTVDGGSDLLAGYGYLGDNSGSTGTVTVDGPGSTWTNSHFLYVGNLGSGTLKITSGGRVSNTYGYLGFNGDSTGTATVDGSDSTWVHDNYFYIGLFGRGTLHLANGGRVSNTDGYLGYNGGSRGEVSIDDSGSTWTNGGPLYVGYYGAGTVTQSAGINSVAGTLHLGYQASGVGTYNLENGTLILQSLAKGSGAAAFNFGGGTLQASGTFSSSLPMTLTGTGGSAKVDTAGYAVTLSGSLSGTGGLTKIGPGALTLSAKNSYHGNTLIQGGTLSLEGGVEAAGTKLIDVQSGLVQLKTTQVSKMDLNIVTALGATFEVANGAHNVGAISGNGSTQVDSGASLTATSITQGTLSLGNRAAAALIPEPSAFALLEMVVVTLLLYAWRRRKS